VGEWRGKLKRELEWERERNGVPSRAGRRREEGRRVEEEEKVRGREERSWRNVVAV
jgi:hypothetical protein